MAAVISATPLDGAIELRLGGELAVAPAAAAEIDRLWQAELQARPDLFDGPILTVTALASDRIEAVAASYRHVVAVRRSPALKAVLNLRPLAVSGILSCPQGLVFGQRSVGVTQGGGRWELVPSGGVEPAAPDLTEALLRELREEIGLQPDQVVPGPPLWLLEDGESGVLDVVMRVATELSAQDIESLHRSHGSAEYGRLSIAPAPSDAMQLLPETRLLLDLLAAAK
jgi:8-oxo-dGTP pyrophosphatase MutT (NUDIX family)